MRGRTYVVTGIFVLFGLGVGYVSILRDTLELNQTAERRDRADSARQIEVVSVPAGSITLSQLSPEVNAMLQGAQGSKGDTGPQGERGVSGPQGPRGLDGGGSGSNGINQLVAGAGLLGGGSTSTVALRVDTGLSTEIINNKAEVKIASRGGLMRGADGIGLTAACDVSELLVWNGSAWVCDTLSIETGPIVLGTDTVGDYIAGVSAGTGLSVVGVVGEGWIPQLSVLYGAASGTAAQGNTQINLTAGTGLTGGGSVSVGAGGSLTLNLSNTGIASGSYGSNSAVATFNVDAQGRLITAGTTTLTNAALQNSSLSVTAGTGLAGGGSVSLGSSTTLSVQYGSSAGTAVQGNTQITCAGGTGNLSGGGNVLTVGAGGTCNSISISNNPSFASITTPYHTSNGGMVFETQATVGTDDIVFITAGVERVRMLEAGGFFFERGEFDATVVVAVPSGAHAQYAFVGPSGLILTNSFYASTLDPIYVNASETPAAGDIAGSFAGGLVVNSGSITNAKLQNSSVGITAGTGLSGGGTVSLGGSTSLAVLYGSSAGSAVQGNTQITCANGAGNLNGAGNTITLGTGGSCGAISITDTPTFTGLTITSSGISVTGNSTVTGTLSGLTGLTVSSGGASIAGNISLGTTSTNRLTVTAQLLGGSPLIFQGSTDDSFATVLAVTNPTMNNTVTLPNASGMLILDTRSILTPAGSGLIGGGNLSVDRTLSLDINGLPSKSGNSSNDLLAVYEASSGLVKKISREDWLQGIDGSLMYQGTWNANLNTPLLNDLTGTKGHLYVVTVGGTANLGSGSTTYVPGDFVIHNGTRWERISSGSPVTSVFGRTGGVTAQSGDYTAIQVTNTPQGNIAATDVQAALNELDLEKLGSLNGLTTNIQSFANDTNIIISSSGSTHTLGWTGTLAVARGGTGLSNITTNGVVYGNGTGSLQVSAAGTAGQVLIANSSGVPTFVTLSGDLTVTSSGAVTISADAVALGADTTGEYISRLGTLTGLSTSGNSGEGSTPGISVLYGSAVNTAVQGSVQLTCASGTGNLSGGGNTVTLGSGGTCNAISTNAAVTFATSVSSPLYTSTGATTLSSSGSNDLTLTSGSNAINLNATTIKSTNNMTLDLNNESDTSYFLMNSGLGTLTLDVEGRASFTQFVSAPTFRSNGTMILQTQATVGADDMIFQTAGTEKMRLYENGNLGLGVSDLGARLQIAPTAATDIGLIVRGAASQSADLLQIRDSANAILVRVNSNGNMVTQAVTVNGTLTTNGNVLLNGKLLTSGITPTIVSGASADCGGSGTPSVSISGNDVSGTITVTTNAIQALGSCTAGILANVTFAGAYGVAPRVMLTPMSANASNLRYYFTSTTGGFSLGTGNAASATTTYSYAYFIAQ